MNYNYCYKTIAISLNERVSRERSGSYYASVESKVESSPQDVVSFKSFKSTDSWKDSTYARRSENTSALLRFGDDGTC